MASSGGHLLLLDQLRPWWAPQHRIWVTFNTLDARSLLAGERAVWAFHPTQRNVRNLLRNTFLAWRIMRRLRPELVVSSGAGVALPFFLLAKPLRIKTVFIEAYERIDAPSLTARLCYPLADLFCLQWDEQKRFFPRGRVIGKLL